MRNRILTPGACGSALQNGPPKGAVHLVEVAGVEPASKKRDMEGRYRLGPNRVTSAGDRTTLIEDSSPGLGCRQGTSRQPIPSHCPADRSHPFSGFTSPLPEDHGDSPGRFLGGLEHVLVRVIGFFVFIGLMRGPADKPPPAPRTPTATCRNQSPPAMRPPPLTPRGPDGTGKAQYGMPAGGSQEAKMFAGAALVESFRKRVRPLGTVRNR